MLDPYNTTITTHDADGIYIPLNWRVNLDKWNSFALAQRMHLSEGREQAENKPEKAVKARAYAPRFSTQYAIDWARKQGWKLIDREWYDYRTKRNHDLEGMVDAIFELPGQDGRTGIQGAGRYQKADHFAKFEAWGGKEKALRRGLKVLYMEFEKGQKEPVLVEDWA